MSAGGGNANARPRRRGFRHGGFALRCSNPASRRCRLTGRRRRYQRCLVRPGSSAARSERRQCQRMASAGVILARCLRAPVRGAQILHRAGAASRAAAALSTLPRAAAAARHALRSSARSSLSLGPPVVLARRFRASVLKILHRAGVALVATAASATLSRSAPAAPLCAQIGGNAKDGLCCGDSGAALSRSGAQNPASRRCRPGGDGGVRYAALLCAGSSNPASCRCRLGGDGGV